MSETASAEFKAQTEETAQRVLQALAGSPGKTAWDLKVELKLSHTALHLALGVLLGQGKVRLKPDQMTLLVEPSAAAEASPAPENVADPAAA